MKGRALPWCMALGVLALGSSAQAGQAPAGNTQPACRVATDTQYAASPQHPVRVGGGAATVGARERAYLEALRGPEGQPVTFKRTGASTSPTHGRPVDVWEITWAGLAVPRVLYLDAYRYGEPSAPAGLTCTQFRLGPPPVDRFLGMDLQAALAVEQGTARDIGPIPLGADGTATRGVALDRFTRIARAARAAAAAGAPMSSSDSSVFTPLSRMVIVAYPTTCGGRAADPVSIVVVSAQTGPVQPQAAPVSGGELAALLPGMTVPAGSAGVVTPLLTFRPGDAVRIGYDPSVCQGADANVSMPMSVTPARGVVMPQLSPVNGSPVPGEPVWLQAVVDGEGRLQSGTFIGGPEALAQRALETLRDWRAEPARINGHPVVSDTLAVLR
jgi:hypothetical protein